MNAEFEKRSLKDKNKVTFYRYLAALLALIITLTAISLTGCGGDSKSNSPKITVTEIIILTPPVRTKYLTGDELDLAGMVVAVTYSDGTNKIITNTDMMELPNGLAVSGFDSIITGIQTITVAYDGKTTTFIVTVIARTYAIKTSAFVSFGALKVSYAQPAAQTVIITNTGTEAVTLTQPNAANYLIGALSTDFLSTSGQRQFLPYSRKQILQLAHITKSSLSEERTAQTQT